MEVGDKVLVIDENHEHYGDLFEVVNPDGSIPYREFVGNHIIAIGRDSKRCVLREGQYAVPPIIPSFDNVTVSDSPKLVSPVKRDNGTRRLFYPVVETHSNGFSFIDDFEQRRTYSKKDLKVITESNCLELLIELQDQVFRLQELVTKTSELVVDDIKRNLDEFNS